MHTGLPTHSLRNPASVPFLFLRKENTGTKSQTELGNLIDKIYTRDYDLREHIPHTWASSNDNLFQSNFSAWSNCEAILRKAPDWPI